MRTQYKYIHFEKYEDKPKTSVWICHNNSNNGELGTVRWYPAWRQYCFFPVGSTVFNRSCLEDINDFMANLRA